MSKKNIEIADMIKDLQTGKIAPGSSEGIEAIKKIASISPVMAASNLYMLNNDVLEKGLKAAGLSEESIDNILKKDEHADPFETPALQEPKPDPETSPFEYDPLHDLENGPRPRR
jgi:hypothetical protein